MLNKIGFFQFDNLIKNRIPFLLFNFGSDLSSWYQSLYQEHLLKNQILTNSGQFLQDFESQAASKDAAIILLCEEAGDSARFFAELEKKGYTNVYVVDGGYQQMMTERSSS